MQSLPFNTHEEKARVLEQAKLGDPLAVHFLQSTYSLRVWTYEEVNALNLLLDSGVVNDITNHYHELRRRSENATSPNVLQRRVQERARKAQAS